MDETLMGMVYWWQKKYMGSVTVKLQRETNVKNQMGGKRETFLLTKTGKLRIL